jgi:signal-transduction protein with cAMP-binding, CBS, and nucleotidyltransferase domain
VIVNCADAAQTDVSAGRLAVEKPGALHDAPGAPEQAGKEPAGKEPEKKRRMEAAVRKVRDVMTAEPIVLQRGQSIADAARAMRDNSVGAVLVVDGDALCGLVTDRDLVVRALAEAASADTAVGEVCSPDLVAVNAGDEAEEARRVMRENAVRRLPVMDDGHIVGIVSIGDLAVDRDEESTLADISAARPND